MKLSVVIPTLNEAGLIQFTLQKVRAAGANEVIVADGGSQDLTRPAPQRPKHRAIRHYSG